MGRPKSEREIDRISVSLDREDYRALKTLAEINDVSAAWLVRRAVTQFLKTGNPDSPARLITAEQRREQRP